MVSTAESCTGGLIAGALTEISGSSAVVDRGFVTYTNNAKMEMLGVQEATLARSVPSRKKRPGRWCMAPSSARMPTLPLR
jgi:PncC family amidohydrolase